MITLRLYPYRENKFFYLRWIEDGLRDDEYPAAVWFDSFTGRALIGCEYLVDMQIDYLRH